ncbi:hypothetical protein QJS10_CPA06g02152 [Acorus calamus]|uniref:Uncharacterized protein n=1 Tax=Acorus calamus TaxID=4465 RepID=A0AAV9EMT0_ACOCL|nr:hypothetical protein QJS10_CPA06g02152 [Acorus calamus]
MSVFYVWAKRYMKRVHIPSCSPVKLILVDDIERETKSSLGQPNKKGLLLAHQVVMWDVKPLHQKIQLGTV